MATTRFSFLNRIEAAATVLKNGGGGAPARDEVAGFLMENAETSDRHTLWQQNSGAGMSVDYDLGADISFNLAGLLGHRPTTAAGTGITSVDVFAVAAAAGYPPGAGWGAALGTIALGSGRDGGVGLGAGVTRRYVRFTLTVGSAFTLGRFFIGSVELDLGVRYAQPPTAIPNREYVQPRRDSGVMGEARVYNWIGDPYPMISLPFLADTTLRAALQTLRSKKQTVVYIDHDDVFREVVVQSLKEQTVFEGAAAARYMMQLELLQLG